QNGGLQPLAAATETSVVNAGDGAGEHPTQALLDALTVKQIKGRLNDLTVAIVGDIRHSRVARSNAHLWRQMGSRVVMVAPPELLPDVDDYPFAFFSTDMAQGLKKADVIITLRLQKERLEKQLTISADDYHIRYGMDHEKLSYAAPDAVVLHPGPMNRGVEISSTLADDATRCAVLRQVTNGVATRMAVFEWLTHAA
ncbi:MAG: aspartate carbamoyltransferase catalytic subunit, partial [Alphaproteobacteria bacterium]|nr:aspartate carbamoyltransferase catalytic subunit [Alphaproteobacteria bacterium]